MPGCFEQEAIKTATSALSLSPDPADHCLAHLAMGKAQVALYHLNPGAHEAGREAWPEYDGVSADDKGAAATAAAGWAVAPEASSLLALPVLGTAGQIFRP